MGQITAKQHFVPQFYLEQWAGSDHQVAWHNLFYEKARRGGIKSKLQTSFYYEDDASNPDNRVENLLGAMENECAPTFAKLYRLARNFGRIPEQRLALSHLRSQIDSSDLERIRRFLAFQYLRVPGALETKVRELSNSSIAPAKLEALLKPGLFTETGYEYVKDRFQLMKLSIYVSTDEEYVTSDWPCFDMKDHPNEPLLGEEIGRDPSVALVFPINPLMLGTLVHPAFTEAAARAPDLIVSVASNADVRNANGLIVQKANNWVATTVESPFVFKLARKRKKPLSPT